MTSSINGFIINYINTECEKGRAMDLFPAWIIPKFEQIGYEQTAIEIRAKFVEINFSQPSGIVKFTVVYIHAEVDEQFIRNVFETRYEPILFVVSKHLIMPLDFVINPPLWFRVLHAIYYGRVYMWEDDNLCVRALHVEYAKREMQWQDVDVSGILFTDTDCKLRDFPGLFHIARFYDKAFWKEQTEPPPKRERKPPHSNANEEFWREQFRKASWETEPKTGKQRAEDVFRDFREAFERNKQQYEARQDYSPPRSTYTPTGDKWLQGFMSTGNLATARAMYKQLAKEWHPDLNPGKSEALETMQAINIAYARAKEILA